MRKHNVKPGLIGKDGRTKAIEDCLRRSPRLAKQGAPVVLSEGKDLSTKEAKEQILLKAKAEKPDFVVIGPEEPLAEGIVDLLEGIGIPCIGPKKELAQLESSKSFTRSLVSKYKIPGNPEYKIFRQLDGIESYLRELRDYVVKPDGLTGGKGVKLSDEHLFSIEDALRYCNELLKHHKAIVIEEKLDGEEFSLQSFCDGTHVHHMIVVQDHKRVSDGDKGPNTGGMGSYSCEDHNLPFLRPTDLLTARKINEAVAAALIEETGEKYKGILYGGFMATRNGIRLLEYNARFGDPETLNVLSLLKTDLVDIFEAIIEEKLHKIRIEFANRATVCKYIVPNGYPENPVRGERIDLRRLPKDSDKLRVYRAALDGEGSEPYLTGSRAIAVVGIGADLDEAQAIAEDAASAIKGPVFHRKDIGTHELIQSRVAHMYALRSKSPVNTIPANGW